MLIQPGEKKAVPQYLQGGYQGDRSRLLTVMYSGRTRDKRKIESREGQLDTRKKKKKSLLSMRAAKQ